PPVPPGPPRDGPQGDPHPPGRERPDRPVPERDQDHGRGQGRGSPAQRSEEGAGRREEGLQPGTRGNDAHPGGVPGRGARPDEVGEIRPAAGDRCRAAATVRLQPGRVRRDPRPDPPHPAYPGQRPGQAAGGGREAAGDQGHGRGRGEQDSRCAAAEHRRADQDEDPCPEDRGPLRRVRQGILGLPVQAGRRGSELLPAGRGDGRAVRQGRVRPQAVPDERRGRHRVRLPPDPGDRPEERHPTEVRGGEGGRADALRDAAARGGARPAEPAGADHHQPAAGRAGRDPGPGSRAGRHADDPGCSHDPGRADDSRRPNDPRDTDDSGDADDSGTDGPEDVTGPGRRGYSRSSDPRALWSVGLFVFTLPEPRPVSTVLLLIASNTFMTIAWYGHLKYRDKPLYVAILVSWLIALPEYALQVPA